MPVEKTARERFAEIASRADSSLDLAEAALWIAAEEYPALDVAREWKRFDVLAAEAKEALGEGALDAAKIARFNAWFFSTKKFHGNSDDYYDAKNSFLNDVLDRGLGIPISLAAVYVEIGRRLEFPVHGVAFPGHFLTKWVLPEGEVFVDPFGGEILSQEGCRELLSRMTGGEMKLAPEMLAAASPRAILVRMLSNLKTVWVKNADLARAVSASDRILMLAPDAHLELRDRGLIWLKAECYRPALADLEEYLRRVPDAPDAMQLAEQLVPLRELARRIS